MTNIEIESSSDESDSCESIINTSLLKSIMNCTYKKPLCYLINNTDKECWPFLTVKRYSYFSADDVNINEKQIKRTTYPFIRFVDTYRFDNHLHLVGRKAYVAPQKNEIITGGFLDDWNYGLIGLYKLEIILKIPNVDEPWCSFIELINNDAIGCTYEITDSGIIKKNSKLNSACVML